jgi:hypothetical protein
MNPQVRFLLAFDRQHTNQHDQPLRIMERFASFTLSVELGEFCLPEKFQKVRSCLFDPLLRNHASCLVFLHAASLLPLGDNILPLPGFFVKLRGSSSNHFRSFQHHVGTRKLEERQLGLQLFLEAHQELAKAVQP